MKVYIKRSYDPPSSDDGFRIFIDRLWPRGLRHSNFHYDLWAKNIAPSNDLRRWFHADPINRWDEFKSRYIAELNQSEAFMRFRQLIQSHDIVTLLYSSHDNKHNNAVVVANMIETRN